MIVLGLTGGIACGKSSVAAMMASRGIPVWDADHATHELYAADIPDISELILREFPEALLTGPLDRQVIADIAFRNPKKLAGLERVFGLHLEIALHTFVAQQRYRPEGSPDFVLLDVPLLFEAGWHRYCDATITVYCSPEVQRERALARPNMTPERFDTIVAKQMTMQQRDALADYSIDTEETPEGVKQQIAATLLAISRR